MENFTVIEYCGFIQYETIGELIHKFKHQIHLTGVKIATYKRVLLVMIESLENIMKHSQCPEIIAGNNQLFLPVFSILKSENHYLIRSSNPIEKEFISPLKSKLDYLNTIDQQGLKDLYKQTITNGEFTNTGGAGLGLIEIAKISGKMINYEFLPIDEKYTRFTLQITINE